MICPICGTQQREADRCVQCHTPISGEKRSVDEEDTLSGITPSLEDSFNAIIPPEEPVVERRPKKVLIATTQRVEGKRIKKYFGLVHANVIVDLCNLSPTSNDAEYQRQFTKGTMSALRDLESEASLVDANAVVATTIEYHRIDSKSILLSAVGTAVLLEAPIKD